MKNLKLNSHFNQKLNDYKFKRICIHPITKNLYAINSNGIYEEKPNGNVVFQINEDLWKDYEESFTSVLNIDFVTSINSFCITSLNGDVISVDIENQVIEVVGSVTDGINASCWSPDEELLLIITGALNLLMMTPEFDVIKEVSLEQEDFGEHKFINVGWGKKETQFHGSEGKHAAKEVKTFNTQVFEWDDKMPRISWRGDGQLFVISYVSQLTSERKLRIIDREGNIQYTSEKVEGLEQALSWKPSGSLITSSQRLSNKHNIVFFEKNGLQHGHFTLPFEPKEMMVIEILWNCDSTVMLIFLESFSQNPKETILQFWKVGNYHWYLKEELRFVENIYHVQWDVDNPLTLYLLTENNLHKYGFINTIDTSRGILESDLAQVAVIDGNKLLVTPFRQAIIPPPISAYEIILPNQIHAIMYGPPQNDYNLDSSQENSITNYSSNDLCIFHGTNTLTIFTISSSDKNASDFKDIKITGAGGNGFKIRTNVHQVFSQSNIKLKDSEDNFSFSCGILYNWLWINSKIIVCCQINGNENYFVLFNLDANGTIVHHKSIKLLQEIITITSLNDGSVLCLQSTSGHLYRFNLKDEILTECLKDGVQIKFPFPCDRVLLCPLDNEVPIGLSSRNKLYLGDVQLLSNCTSVCLHNDHLLATTTTHKLIVAILSLESLMSLKNDEKIDVGTRNLERGSRIVTAVPYDTKVLMQMPRGNLEMIHPRPLVIHTLKKLLNRKHYHQAVNLMRKHRIDLNLIYDNNPEIFLANIEEFIIDVNNPSWIDLFIANLNNDDVTKTMYSSSFQNNPQHLSINKTDQLAESLRNAMIKIDEDKYLLPILTTYVKSSKGEMDVALIKLKKMKEVGRHNKVDEGLRHLMYIADANELCDLALGTYDFDLVMLVFEKSQKDPKEYIPFLNELKKLEPDYRKFRINVHLRRYKKALESLTDFEKYTEECLTLIKKENLYSQALEVISRKVPFYKTVCIVYGDYLSNKGFENEAASMYTIGGNFELALLSYVRANNWKRALITAFQLGYTKQQINTLCLNFIEDLKSKNLYSDAAIIYETYLQNEEEAVDCLANAYQWEDAFLIACKANRDDLVETIIKPKINNYYNSLINELNQYQTSYNEYFTRLIKVRLIKKDEYLDFLEGKNCNEIDPDLCSDSSTITDFSHNKSNFSSFKTNSSSASGKSYRSSKNKRKLERKKYSIKEGSAFEDVGLVAAIHETMVKVDRVTKLVSNLNRVLSILDEREKAKALQDILDLLLQDMKKKRHDIWINCAPPDDEGSDAVDFGPHMTTDNALYHLRMGAASGFGQNTFFIQRLNELEPHLRFPPAMENSSDWKLFILRSN